MRPRIPDFCCRREAAMLVPGALRPSPDPLSFPDAHPVADGRPPALRGKEACRNPQHPNGSRFCSERGRVMLAFRAEQGSRNHARDARRGIRAGLAPDPITGWRAAVGTAGSRLKRQRNVVAAWALQRRSGDVAIPTASAADVGAPTKSSAVSAGDRRDRGSARLAGRSDRGRWRADARMSFGVRA